jgi:sporulation protein YqfC
MSDKKIKRPLLESFQIDSPQIILQGNRMATIEGCKKVLIYHENEIRLVAGKKELSLYGRNLMLRYLTPEKIVIDGEFDKIEYWSQGGNG